jgi:hypothetical protein
MAQHESESVMAKPSLNVENGYRREKPQLISINGISGGVAKLK